MLAQTMEKTRELFHQLLDASPKGRLFPLQIVFCWQLAALLYLLINRAARGEGAFQRHQTPFDQQESFHWIFN